MPRGRRGTARRKSKAVDVTENEANEPDQSDTIMSTTEHPEDMATTPVDSETPNLSKGAVAAPPPVDADEKTQPLVNVDNLSSSQPLASTSEPPLSPAKASLSTLLNPGTNLNGTVGNPFPPLPTFPLASTSQQPPPSANYGPQDIERWRQDEIDRRQAEVS